MVTIHVELRLPVVNPLELVGSDVVDASWNLPSPAIEIDLGIFTLERIRCRRLLHLITSPRQFTHIGVEIDCPLAFRQSLLIDLEVTDDFVEQALGYMRCCPLFHTEAVRVHAAIPIDFTHEVVVSLNFPTLPLESAAKPAQVIQASLLFVLTPVFLFLPPVLCVGGVTFPSTHFLLSGFVSFLCFCVRFF